MLQAQVPLYYRKIWWKTFSPMQQRMPYPLCNLGQKNSVINFSLLTAGSKISKMFSWQKFYAYSISINVGQIASPAIPTSPFNFT